MNKKEAGQLVDKYLQGKASLQEEAIVQSWLMNHTSRNMAGAEAEGAEVAGSERAYALPPEIWSNVQTAIHQKKVRLWPRIGIAAAVATIVFGLWFFNGESDLRKRTKGVEVVNDIAPGSQGATLILASGKKIRLKDAANGELAEEAGISVTKTAEGQLIYEIKASSAEMMNTLSTAKGETYQVRLPDGSKVWLNAASSLKYPAGFPASGIRKVTLSGEGYFEIAKDASRPFIVKTNAQEVEVLGTHFNVNSYADEPAVMTTLLEGSVKVRSSNLEQTIRPGQQAVNNGQTLVVKNVNTDNITDWKQGDFNLNRVDFRSAMRKISRWYDVEVIYDRSVPGDFETVGWVSRDKQLSSVLKSIESIGIIRFKIEGRKIYVSKSNN